MSHHRLETLSRHVDIFGIVERLHGNTKKLPANTYLSTVIEHLHSLTTLLNRMPNLCRVECPISKTAEFYSYQMIGPRQESTVSMKPSVTIFMRLGRTKVYKVWKEQTPFIVTMKHTDDLCFNCQKLTTTLSNCRHLSDDEKALRLAHYTNHLNLAKQTRAGYNQ